MDLESFEGVEHVKKIETQILLFVVGSTPQWKYRILASTLKTSNYRTFEMASFSTTASSVDAFMASATDLALAQFIRVYADVLVSRGVKGPSPDDLLRWMREEFSGGVVPSKAASDAVYVKEEPIDITEDTEVITIAEEESKPVVNASSASKKVSAKLLKKLTVKTGEMKVRKVKQKDGTTKEVEYEHENQVELPYLPHCVDYSETCQAIKANGNLFTPCLTRCAKGSSYCTICNKSGLKYGTLKDREACESGKYEVKMDITMQVKDKETNEVSTVEKTTTKKEISYGTWLQKRNMDRTFVENLIAEHGLDITIPESCFEVNKTKAKRGVKKSPSTSSDDEASSVDSESAAEDKSVKRGRPVKKVAKAADGEEDKPKKRGRPTKEAPKEVEEEVLEEPEPVSEPEPEFVAATNIEIDDDESEEEEVVAPTNGVQNLHYDEEDEMHYFTYKGLKFGFDDENILFRVNDEDPEDAEIVGAWDPEAKMPDFESEFEEELNNLEKTD
jgi:hypothetical protein